MEFFCTTCCKEKRTDPGNLPAIERYLSERIRRVHRESMDKGRRMLIFSGKFGLLRPEEPIPWYDQKLESDGVGEIVPSLVNQLREYGASKLIFFCRPKNTEGWQPYHEALETACKQAGVELATRFTAQD